MTAARDETKAEVPAAEEAKEQYRKLSPGPGRLASEVSSHQRARIHSATIEIVAQRGYGALRVREIVQLARVSSRTFYENFESKEDCFLRTYEMVMRRASRRIIAGQEGERDWRERPLLIFAALARELESEPDAGRFALIEAYAAGPIAQEQIRLAERTFEAMLGESFARAPGGVVVPPLIIEGMIGGVAGVAQNRLKVGLQGELLGLGGELIDWALSYPGPSADALAGLDGQSVWRNTRFQPHIPAGAGRGEAWPSTGDRGVLLASVVELAVANGYDKLTVTRIRVDAKVSRKVFDVNFEGVEDCFLAAMEQKAGEAFAQAAHAQTAGRAWPGSVYRGIAALCEQVAADPFLAMVCLTNPFTEDSIGSLARQRLIATIVEQFGDAIPGTLGTLGTLGTEASDGALWALFHRHMIRDWAQRRQIAATLAFVALAPVIGDEAAVAAIRREQTA